MALSPALGYYTTRIQPGRYVLHAPDGTEVGTIVKHFTPRARNVRNMGGVTVWIGESRLHGLDLRTRRYTMHEASTELAELIEAAQMERLERRRQISDSIALRVKR